MPPGRTPHARAHAGSASRLHCPKPKPNPYAQGFGRKGAALHGQGRFDKAIAAYEEGLKIEPNLAMLTNGLADAKREAERQEAGG